ncbi:nitrate reductase [Rodentibacter caecimuris]|uniref:Chaperone NapD n=2 Tax=Rodentibacter TaxID=1960084 RepID=A0A4S2Q3E8_9PAST|nr:MULTISPECIES: chaperone NapD [Pasteurellaceae]MCQ9124132.1 chaperone NapD [Rodentibacter heylii]MCR1838018.1 chaperone NapD [Pasteurella caecimuris]MCU0107669.1 chaperone NapD [Pasteurella caecimuris]MCX2962352.1 chaperone NapD [Rodentibacter heylii]OOF71738.1 nitrate reductase [Rodentibacter heylii]
MNNKENLIDKNIQDWHVVGLIVQGNPQKMVAIQTALLEIEHTEIPTFDEKTGKLVVVMQSHDQHILLDNMESVNHIDGVINVSLIYHEQDERKK